MSAAPDTLEKQEIVFENGGRAEILHIKQPVEADEALKALGMDVPAAKAAIIVGGSTTAFSDRLKNRLIDLISRGVAQAALDPEAILLDEGTKSGVSEIVGLGVADRGRKTKLVGILPPRKSGGPGEPAVDDIKNLDPNHTHLILSEQEWPAWQTETLCRLAESAATNKGWILTVLVGGEIEGTALELALETVRRGWPLVVIQGSGPLADEIVRLKRVTSEIEKRTGRVWKLIRPFSMPSSCAT
jgi:SLOG in TRPM, prokaryote